MKTLLKTLSYTCLLAFICLNQAQASSFYDLSALDASGNKISLSAHKNKVLMVVNVASRCGYTSQYADLQKLFEKYKSKGFVILGFPSNEFGQQEPGTNQEIQKFCKLNYGVTFPVMAKIKVNGPEASEIFKWLTNQKSFNGPVTWNFNKFLIDKKGLLVKRFESSVTPKETEKDIVSLL